MSIYCCYFCYTKCGTLAWSAVTISFMGFVPSLKDGFKLFIHFTYQSFNYFNCNYVITHMSYSSLFYGSFVKKMGHFSDPIQNIYIKICVASGFIESLKYCRIYFTAYSQLLWGIVVTCRSVSDNIGTQWWIPCVIVQYIYLKQTTPLLVLTLFNWSTLKAAIKGNAGN